MSTQFPDDTIKTESLLSKNLVPGNYVIRSMLNKNKCIDYNQKTGNMQIFDCNYGDNQQFYFGDRRDTLNATIDVGNNDFKNKIRMGIDGSQCWDSGETSSYGAYFKMPDLNGGGNKCMQNTGNSISDGTSITIWDCDGSKNQRLYYNSRGNEIKIGNANSDKCLDIPGGNITDNAPLQTWTCNNTGAQKFIYNRNNDKKIRVKDKPNYCIGLPQGDTKNGNRFKLFNCDNNPNDPAYKFTADRTGSNFKPYNCTPGNPNQTWQYDPVTYEIYRTDNNGNKIGLIDLHNADTTNENYINFHSNLEKHPAKQWILSEIENGRPVKNRNCADLKWMWDYECNHPSENNYNANGDCTSGSQCERNKLELCNDSTIDLSTNKYCLNYCQMNKDKCNNSLHTYCNNPDNVTKKTCFGNWCNQNSNNCDLGAKAYCDQHPDDNDFCACYETNALNSLKKSIPGDQEAQTTLAQTLAENKINPICWNLKCSAGGSSYTTSTMLQRLNNLEACPKCIQNINIKTLNVKDKAAKIQQSCQINEQINKTTKDISNPNTNNQSNPNEQSDSNEQSESNEQSDSNEQSESNENNSNKLSFPELIKLWATNNYLYLILGFILLIITGILLSMVTKTSPQHSMYQQPQYPMYQQPQYPMYQQPQYPMYKY